MIHILTDYSKAELGFLEYSQSSSDPGQKLRKGEGKLLVSATHWSSVPKNFTKKHFFPRGFFKSLGGLTIWGIKGEKKKIFFPQLKVGKKKKKKKECLKIKTQGLEYV